MYSILYNIPTVYNMLRYAARLHTGVHRTHLYDIIYCLGRKRERTEKKKKKKTSPGAVGGGAWGVLLLSLCGGGGGVFVGSVNFRGQTVAAVRRSRVNYVDDARASPESAVRVLRSPRSKPVSTPPTPHGGGVTYRFSGSRTVPCNYKDVVIFFFLIFHFGSVVGFGGKRFVVIRAFLYYRAGMRIIFFSFFSRRRRHTYERGPAAVVGSTRGRLDYRASGVCTYAHGHSTPLHATTPPR